MILSRGCSSPKQPYEGDSEEAAAGGHHPKGPNGSKVFAHYRLSVFLRGTTALLAPTLAHFSSAHRDLPRKERTVGGS